ncbi:chromate transporter [uncultured Thiocystis sp.]|jgi:chromate transporter|uniref:chromate transporter n=1 Tax=uncultured Thiocystis sp. TaxID=1202134 RepID=UPI0025FC839C|nr:chromate transporter [uncultured Thiocystis sp.]
MKDLVSLLNVFTLLSLMAVGGGTAVIPEMQHETVTVHHWVTDTQFAAIYSLGQLAPGPNMTMVGIIGDHAAGVAGFFLVLFAFYFPASLLTYGVSYIWDRYRENPWRAAIQRGLAPITIGLMLAGVYAVGKTASFNLDRPLWFNGVTLGFGLAIVLLLFWKRINPAVLILTCGVLGWFILR